MRRHFERERSTKSPTLGIFEYPQKMKGDTQIRVDSDCENIWR